MAASLFMKKNAAETFFSTPLFECQIVANWRQRRYTCIILSGCESTVGDFCHCRCESTSRNSICTFQSTGTYVPCTVCRFSMDGNLALPTGVQGGCSEGTVWKRPSIINKSQNALTSEQYWGCCLTKIGMKISVPDELICRTWKCGYIKKSRVTHRRVPVSCAVDQVVWSVNNVQES